ncbi:TPA: hypothetical protein ACHS3I_005234 [Escherichia coli]
MEFPLTLMLPPAVDPVPVEMLPPAIFPIPGTSKETLSDIFPITEFIFSLAIEQALLIAASFAFLIIVSKLGRFMPMLPVGHTSVQPIVSNGLC